MKAKIFNDVNQFLKEGEKEKVMVLRMVKSAILELEREEKKEVTNQDIIQIISKQIKTRKESIEQFKRGNRHDLVEKTENEIAILQDYLPTQFSEAEIDQIIENVFNKIKPTSVKDIGLIMKEIMPQIKGKADIGLVNQKIKTKLGA